MDPANRVTEKPSNQNQQMQRRQQQLLKCPRCESMNTKFCYYNNYSLAQPRHFCKSCKRYWTSGGTLRNVPMGGGCKKNKKIKKTFTSTVDHNPNPNPHNSITSKDTLNPFALGFSASDGNALVDNYANDSMPLVSRYLPMLSGGFTSNCNIDNTMASVLSSSIQEQPEFLWSAQFGDGGGSVVNDVEIEGTKFSMNDCNSDLNGQNDDDQIKLVESSDPTSFPWTIPGGEGGEWINPTNSMVFFDLAKTT